MSTYNDEHEEWTDEQWAQWAADADQRDIEEDERLDAKIMREGVSPAAAPSGHGVMPGGVQHRARRLAAATTEAAVGRVVGSPL